MKLSTVIFLVLSTSLCIAQKKDKPKYKADSILQKLDTLKPPSLKIPVSVKNKFSKSDSLQIKFTSNYDSIKNIADKPQVKINQYNSNMDSVTGRLTKPTDSIARILQKPQEKMDQFKNKLNNSQAAITEKIDSLVTLPNTSKFLEKHLDSLHRKSDSVRQKLTKISNRAEKSKEAANKLSSSVGEKTSKIESSTNEKLELISKNSATNLPSSISLPSTKLPALNVPGMKDLSIKLPSSNLKLPQSSLPNISVANKINMPNLSGGKSSPSSIKNPELDQLNGLSGGADIGNVTKEISQLSGEAGKYGKQLNEIQSTDLNGLSEDAEDKVGNLIGGEKQLADIKAQEAMLAKWNSDPAVAKELALSKAKEEAVNHFAGKEKELKTVMEQLSGLKAKARDAEGVIDLFKKRQGNPMKSKTFRERLDLGVSLQFLGKSNVLMLDFNPYVGYKISGRFTAGLGWVQRMPLSTKNYTFVEIEDVYGPRTYLQFKIGGNAFLKAEVEFLNEFGRVLGQPSSERGRQWVTNYLVGYKQSFRLSKRMGGHAQVLYNLFDPDHQSPYMERLNIRFGFEFFLKKHRK